jgi:hypothetical protein
LVSMDALMAPQRVHLEQKSGEHLENLLGSKLVALRVLLSAVDLE